MAARPDPRVQARRLRESELPEARRLASEAFSRHPFYRALLGFDPARFDAYWELFLPMALADSGARVHALECSGALGGLLVAQVGAFPRADRGIVFLWKLGRRIGLGALIHYLRFVAAYEKAMRGTGRGGGQEARGLWLLVGPSASRFGRGALLLRQGIEELLPEGVRRFTGLVDAGDPRLLEFYRRAGFTIHPPFLLRGRRAATIEMRPGLAGPQPGLAPTRRAFDSKRDPATAQLGRGKPC